MTESSDTYNLLAPAKKLSQLIAQSWLDNESLILNKEYLVEHDILTQEEADYFDIVEAKENSDHPEHFGEIDVVGKSIEIAYRKRPTEISDDLLQAWVASPSDSAPWLPEDAALAKALLIIKQYLMLS